MPSQLDHQQILQALYDHSSNTIGTTATIASGSISVSATKFNIIDRSLYVGTTSQIVVPENENRNYLLIQNGSPKRIWLDFNTDTAQIGFPSILLPAQALLIYDSTNLYIGSVTAISDVNNIPLIIKEG